MQLLSIRLFQAVVELVEEEGKKSLEKNIRQSLFPLFCCLRDKNQFVAEVRISEMLVCNLDVTWLPPVLMPCEANGPCILLLLATEQQFWGTCFLLSWQS